jgi:hypothetical protein
MLRVPAPKIRRQCNKIGFNKMRMQNSQNILRKSINTNYSKPYKVQKFVRGVNFKHFVLCSLVVYAMLSCANIAIAEITPNSTIVNGLRNIILTPKDVRLNSSVECYYHHLPHVHTNTGRDTNFAFVELLHHTKPQTANVNAMQTSPLLGEGLDGGLFPLDNLGIAYLKSVNVYKFENFNIINPWQWENLTPLFASINGISI